MESGKGMFVLFPGMRALLCRQDGGKVQRSRPPLRRSGEDDAYRELIEGYGGRLLSVSRRIMRNEEDARDCVQDVFLSAFRSIGRFEGKSRLGTWLHRITVNACLARLRSRKRRCEEPIDHLLSQFDRYGFLIGPTEASPAKADELIERAEVREWVLKAIDLLPENFRSVLLLRDIEEYDTADTAEMLEITPGAVRIRLHRARTALRTLIGSAFL